MTSQSEFHLTVSSRKPHHRCLLSHRALASHQVVFNICGLQACHFFYLWGRKLEQSFRCSLTINRSLDLSCMFPGACQRGIGPPTRPVHGLKSSSSCCLFAVSDDSAVTTRAATVIINFTDHQPLGQLCPFLPAGTEWISRDFTDGEEISF